MYTLGGSIDRLFFEEALPSPTFGTGGLFWASITMALLTLPLVYATALLLIIVILLLIMVAIHIRNSLREKYRGL